MLYFTIQNRFQAGTRKVSEGGGCEMTILSSDYPRILVESSFYWRKHFRDFPANLDLQDFVAGAVFGEVGG